MGRRVGGTGWQASGPAAVAPLHIHPFPRLACGAHCGQHAFGALPAALAGQGAAACVGGGGGDGGRPIACCRGLLLGALGGQARHVGLARAVRRVKESAVSTDLFTHCAGAARAGSPLLFLGAFGFGLGGRSAGGPASESTCGYCCKAGGSTPSRLSSGLLAGRALAPPRLGGAWCTLVAATAGDPPQAAGGQQAQPATRSRRTRVVAATPCMHRMLHASCRMPPGQTSCADRL